jgi:uncharacterized protein YjcR
MPLPESVREQQARERSERTRDMYQGYLRGMSLAQVGSLYGVGPERVRQLFVLEGLPTRRRGWRAPNAR